MMKVPKHSLFLPHRHFTTIIFAFVFLQLALWTVTSITLGATLASPAISNVRILTPTVARFEKFEIAFDVETSAEYLNLPFDAKPPQGLRSGMGVSVDALFSSDNWKTTITQPAFFFQPYTYQFIKNRDHWTPNSAPYWLVRFAPRTAGDWQVRLRVQDQGGTKIFPEKDALHFRALEGGVTRYDGLRQNPYTRHGFLRVSKNDPRYFEFEDGTPFTGLGYNAGSENGDSVQKRYREWQVNGLQFARVWMSGMGINASQWTPWGFPSQPFSYSLPTTLLTSAQHLPDAEFAFHIDPDYPCLYVDFWQNGIPVEPNTIYSLTMQTKLIGVTPKPNAPNAGFVVARDGWIGKNCNELNAEPLLPARIGKTDWFTATASFQTGPDEYFLDYLYFALHNIEQGWAAFDSVQVVAANDPAGVNILRHGRADSHLFFDSMNAAKWDLLIAEAEQHGVFLKIVSDEKNEWIRNVIQSDGTIGNFDNNNFYAKDGSQVRWLDEAWWRYLIARWGYSTAIHSFEFVNEGDPYNGNHYNAVDAMGRYFDENDPSRHMITTSMWHSFPNDEFWSNPKYSAVDYADIHAYITTGWGDNASFVPSANLETRPEDQFQGKNTYHIPAAQKLRKSIHPRGVTLNEPGEWTIRYWMKQENFQATCDYGKSGSGVGVYWQLDGKQQGIVPNNVEGKTFLCSSPAGTFDWREFTTAQDRNGKPIPLEHRLILKDATPHQLSLGVQNAGGVAGDAWIADVQLISPSGKRVPVLGEFDDTSFTADTAWFTAAYSLLWGGASPVGAHKPLVRGETAINNSSTPESLPALKQDHDGIWLHNFVWGQINPGGMYDLLWFATQDLEANPPRGRSTSLLGVYLPYANFIADIPINNGNYRDANTQASNPLLRVWGQRDDVNGRAHLWVQNRAHDWQSAVAGTPITPINGAVRLDNMPSGTYRVEWWDTYNVRNQIFATDHVVVNNSSTLTLTLPSPLLTDVGIQMFRMNP